MLGSGPRSSRKQGRYDKAVSPTFFNTKKWGKAARARSGSLSVRVLAQLL